MKEKILFENRFNEAIVEPGFDQMFAPKTAGHPNNPSLDAPAPGNSTQITVNQAPNSGQGNTNTTDIARNAPIARLAQNAISKSLPYMIGYVQPISGPGAYAMGLTWKEDTKIADAYANAALATRVTPGTNPQDDPVIVRQYIDTDIREVKLDLTNETAQDIEALFGDNFPENYDKFQKSGGEVFGKGAILDELPKFFLTVGQQRMTHKINTDFTTWLESIASVKGTHTIDSYDKMDEIIGVLGELRETLYKGTDKTARLWALVSPRIANFLATFYGTQFNSANALETGRRKPSDKENGYVFTMGDIAIYQSPMVAKKTTDGSETYTDQLEATGEIYMGMTGGPDTSSVYYYPYKEYIVQGGGDYYTGQSNVFFRVRDTWSTNPLDTLDKKQQTPTTPKANKNSSYVVKANIVFDAKANLLG